MNEKNFQDKYDALFKNLDEEKRIAIWYTSYFCFRRFMVAQVTIYCNSDIGIVLCTFELLILSTISILILKKPMKLK